eukprot:evm.model.NODE_22936_length_14830_cov_46.494606.1
MAGLRKHTWTRWILLCLLCTLLYVFSRNALHEGPLNILTTVPKDLCTFDNLSQNLEERSELLAFQHVCFSLPDFSEFCLYENVCWGNNQLLIPNDNDQAGPRIRFPSDEIDSYQNLPAYGAGNFDDMQSVVLPRRSFLESQATFVTRASLVEAKHMSLGFLTGFDSATENLFHFAESTLLFHAVKSMGGTFLAALPDLSIALLRFPRPKPNSWIAQFSKLLFGNETPILWLDAVDALTQKKPLCFRQLIVSGTIIHLILGPKDAKTLREQAFKELAIVSPHRRQPPRFILIEKREHRTWTNRVEILEVIKSTGVPYKEVSMASMSFEEQVRSLNSAGVFCGAHGAGMTNLLWMSTGAAVVEAFPCKVWQYNLYAEVARNAGLFHRPVYGNVSSVDFGEKGRTAVDCLNDPSCNVGLKQDFYLDPNAFKHALEEALNLAGIDS